MINSVQIIGQICPRLWMVNCVFELHDYQSACWILIIIKLHVKNCTSIIFTFFLIFHQFLVDFDRKSWKWVKIHNRYQTCHKTQWNNFLGWLVTRQNVQGIEMAFKSWEKAPYRKFFHFSYNTASSFRHQFNSKTPNCMIFKWAQKFQMCPRKKIKNWEPEFKWCYSVPFCFRCSTKVNKDGDHVGGIAAWGHCPMNTSSCTAQAIGNHFTLCPIGALSFDPHPPHQSIQLLSLNFGVVQILKPRFYHKIYSCYVFWPTNGCLV